MITRRVTLSDIAKKAGVHVTTVSLAMRNSPQLPPATRSRIQSLAAKMGYTPDPLLRALIAYRFKGRLSRNPTTLAYITNASTRWGWRNAEAHRQFFAGAEASARALGYNLEHFWMHDPGLSQRRLDRILYSRGINGLIIASHGREMADTVQLNWAKYCAVKIDYFPHEPALHNITSNQCNIVRLAIRKAMALGYRKVGLVMHRGWDHAVDQMWTAGFASAQQVFLSENPIPPFLFPGDHSATPWIADQAGDGSVEAHAFGDWLNAYRPDVILSKGSFVLPALQTLGLRVPNDLAFIDLFLEEFSGLTAGIRQNHESVGSKAVELLTSQLRDNRFGTPEIPTTTFVEGTWFDGASCPRARLLEPALAI